MPKIKKILLYEMKFVVPNYSCLQSPWLGGYRPQIPVLSVLCPQLNLLNPPKQNPWVRHCVFRMFEEKVLRRIFGPEKEEVTGDCRKSHGEWLRYLYPSPNVVRALSEKGWDGPVVCHGGVRGDMRVGFCWGNAKEADALEDIDWDGRQILNWISKV